MAEALIARPGAGALFTRALLLGTGAGAAVGGLDLALAVLTQGGPVADAAAYTVAITTLAGAAFAACAGLLLVIGRLGAAAASPRRAALPLGLAAGIVAFLLNRGLFTGPGISERSWAAFAEAVFAPFLGLAAVMIVVGSANCGSWRRRAHGAAAAACLIGFLILGLANVGAGPFGRLNAYPSLKLEFTLLTWIAACGVVTFPSSTRPLRARRDGILSALIIVVAVGVAVVERDHGDIHRVRAKIANLPMAAASRVMRSVEDALLTRIAPLEEVEIEDVEVLDSSGPVDRSRLASLLDARFPNRREMNVLWIAIDALRQDRLGCYGYTRPTTPHIDRFAAMATRFTRAVTPTPASAMAYSAVLNGVAGRASPTYVAVHGVGASVPDDFSFAALLRAAGRKTMGVTAFSRATSARPDFKPMAAGFELFNSDAHIVPLRADQITDRALALLDKANQGPFFLFAHFLDPHAPYEFREGHEFGNRPVDAYDSEIAFTDAEVGRLLDGLSDRNLDESTIVVLFSDHGESFGEHNNWRHGGSLYQHETSVPLLIRIPGDSGGAVSRWVSLADLGPTMLSLLEIRDPHRRLGRDLAPLMVETEVAWTDFAYAERPQAPVPGPGSRNRAVWSGDLKVIWNLEANTYETFDLQADPGETRNRFDPSDARQARLLGMMKSFDRRIDTFWGTSDGQRPTPRTEFRLAVDALESAGSAGLADALGRLLTVLKTHGLSADNPHLVDSADLERLRLLAERAAPGAPPDLLRPLARLLAYCDDPRSMDAMIEMQGKTRDPWVASRIAEYRHHHGNSGVPRWLAGSFSTTPWSEKLLTAFALATAGDPTGDSFLRACLRSPFSADVLRAGAGLAALGSSDALLHALLSDERFWRSEKALAPLVPLAIADDTSTGTAFLIHVAHSISGPATTRAREALGARLGDVALKRARDVYLAVFGAKEALRYGRAQLAMRALRPVGPEDDALMGPMWLMKVYAALGAKDEAALADGLTRLSAACPRQPRILQLVRTLRASRVYDLPAKDIPIELRFVGTSFDGKPTAGGLAVLEVEITNNGPGLVLGGSFPGGLQLGLAALDGRGRISELLHTIDLPIDGVRPGTTARLSAALRFPLTPASYDLAMVLLKRHLRAGRPIVLRLPTLVVSR